VNPTALLTDIREALQERRAQTTTCRWGWGCHVDAEPDEVLCRVHLELDRAPDVLSPAPTVWAAARGIPA
jgi:hypothetical protein